MVVNVLYGLFRIVWRSHDLLVQLAVRSRSVSRRKSPFQTTVILIQFRSELTMIDINNLTTTELQELDLFANSFSELEDLSSDENQQQFSF